MITPDRPKKKFCTGDWVVPLSVENSLKYNSRYYHGDTKSHVGHYIRITEYRTLSNGDTRYLAAGCWYSEKDLTSKEAYMEDRKISKMKFSVDMLAELF